MAYWVRGGTRGAPVRGSKVKREGEPLAVLVIVLSPIYLYIFTSQEPISANMLSGKIF